MCCCSTQQKSAISQSDLFDCVHHALFDGHRSCAHQRGCAMLLHGILRNVVLAS
jgi:hypothetical protein